MVIAAKDEFCSRIERLQRRLHAASGALVARRRSEVHALTSRRGLAGWSARLALRWRHASELGHALRRSAAAHVARRDRAARTLQMRLEARDLRRTLAALRGRLGQADSRVGAAAARTHDRAAARLTAATGRLQSLSPLAVLARGYAVCWNGERTAIVRSANAVSPGDRVRVTLQEGELDCEVRGTDRAIPLA
jgi:exodeoxyribonuclease VII large subunit